MAERFLYYISGLVFLLIPGQESYAQGVLPIHRYHNENLGSLTWDATAGNAVINNGNGTWNGPNNVWVAKPPAGANSSWINGSNATFGGNPGTGSAGTVTVNGTRAVKNLTFNPTPSGNFTLAGSGTLDLQGGLILTNQSATINTKLTGSGPFLKRGTAILTLGGNNALTGNITISQGNIRISSATAAGTAAIILGDDNTGNNDIGWYFGGSLQPTNNITVASFGTGTITIGTYSNGTETEYGGNITLNKDVTFFDGTNDRSSFEGIISGNSNITIDGTGTWNSSTGTTARITFDNNSNSFTGVITINPNKAFQLNNTNVVNSQTIVNNGFLIMNAGSTGTIGTLTGNGVCEIHPEVGSQSLLIGNDGGSGTFSGTIRDGSGSGVNLSLVKAGSGTASLSGTNSYTGPTTVNAGILNFAAATAVPASATWNIAVANSAPGASNSGKMVLKNAPALAGKTINIVITESGTGVNFQVATWTGTATGTPTLRVNGVTRTFGVTTSGTTVTYSTTAGITVIR